MSCRAVAAISPVTRCASGTGRTVLPWLLAGCATASCAQEIALFNLTDIEGHVATAFLGTRDTTRQGERSGQSASDWRTDLFINTHGYVYHPNFLTLDIGGGPVLQAGSLETDTGATQSRGALYNLVGRANFLRGKPVNGALFYEHLNPVLTIAPGEILQQETARYGFELAASAAAVPAPLRLEVSRTEANGRSDERVMRDRTDLFNLRATRPIGPLGATQVQIQASRQASTSGSTSLPIQSSAAQSHSMDLDTRLPFGPDARHEFINLVSFNRQSYVVGGKAMPALADLNVLLDLRLKHSDAVSTFGTAHYTANDNGERTAITRSATSGVAWSPSADFELTSDAHAQAQQAGPFAATDHGLATTLRQQFALPAGMLTASYRVRHDRRTQDAAAPTAQVVGERTSLSITSGANLALQRVVAGSVVISNLTRSQVFVENIDYRLVTIGLTTRVERQPGGSILEGEDVLIDYAYDLGGSFASAESGQTFNLNWTISPQLSVYFRDSRTSDELLSGAPSFPLDDTRGRLWGIRGDQPFAAAGLALTAGGNVERERFTDAISPFVRQSVDLYLQSDEELFDLAALGVSLRRMNIDYANSTQDTDLRGYGLRLSTRWRGADVAAARNFECDHGTPVARCRLSDTITAQWRERQLTLHARLAHGRETQGGFERANTVFHVSLRRDL